MPAPVLAELIGITDNNAADWARLAARDRIGYIADRFRTRLNDPRHRRIARCAIAAGTVPAR